MDTWNYRVVKKFDEGQIYYTIVEIYYDENGKPVGWSESDENTLVWLEYESLKGTVSLIISAFEKPMLIMKDNQLIEDNSQNEDFQLA